MIPDSHGYYYCFARILKPNYTETIRKKLPSELTFLFSQYITLTFLKKLHFYTDLLTLACFSHIVVQYVDMSKKNIFIEARASSLSTY